MVLYSMRVRNPLKMQSINQLNGMLADGRKIFVGLHMRRQNREVKFTNVYIKNLPTEFTDDDLRQQFAPFGEITSAVVMRHSDGASKCFGFVNFEKPEYAAEAVQKLNGKSMDDKVLYVGRAQKKAERQAELRAKFQQGSYGKVEKPQGINLYLKNIDDSISNEELKKLFEEFGEITSCTVIILWLFWSSFFIYKGQKNTHSIASVSIHHVCF